MNTAPNVRFSHAELTVRLDQAWRVLEFNQNLVRAADQKAYLLVGMSALLATFVANNLEKILKMGALQSSLLLLFLVASAVFFACALVTLLARAQKPAGDSSANLIFFGDIASRPDAAHYARDVAATDLHAVLDDLTHQAHSVASIATRKYRSYRHAWIALIAEVVFFLLLEFSVALRM